MCTRDATEHTWQLVVEGLLDFIWAAMSMLYLASYLILVPYVFRVGQLLLGRWEFWRSIVQLTVGVFFFLADIPLSTEDEVKQRGPW